MKKDINKKLLILSAHPDDHLSCAGTAMYLKSLGFEISEVVFTAGESSVNKTKKTQGVVDKAELVKVRQREFLKASKIMGTNNYFSLGLPNGNLQRSHELVLTVVKLIRKEKPLVVICENPNDYHVDHRVVAEVVTEAVDMAGWGISREIGEPYKTPLALYMGTLLENERIDILVDITKFWGKKLDMLKIYKSQMGSFGFQLNESLGKYCGYKLRVPYAESFQLMKGYPVRANLLLELLIKAYEK